MASSFRLVIRLGTEQMSGGGPSLLMAGPNLCVYGEHLPNPGFFEVEHTIPGELCRLVTLVEVRLLKMDRAGS